MELLAPATNLQKYSIQAIEELFPELHGWGNAVHLNDSGLPGDPAALWLIKNGVLQPDSIGLLITDYALLDQYWQSFFFDNPTTPKQVETSAVTSDSNINKAGGNVFYSAIRGVLVIYGASPTELAERRLWRYLFGTRFEQLSDSGDAMLDNGNTMHEVANA